MRRGPIELKYSLKVFGVISFVDGFDLIILLIVALTDYCGLCKRIKVKRIFLDFK